MRPHVVPTSIVFLIFLLGTPAVVFGQTPRDGEELYRSLCVPCHGRSGSGEGIAAPELNPTPFSFAAPADVWLNSPTIDGISRTLTEGIEGTGMKQYTELSEDEKRALGAYVLRLRSELTGHDEPDGVEEAEAVEEVEEAEAVEELEETERTEAPMTETERREEEMFGGDTSEREAEMFGEASDDGRPSRASGDETTRQSGEDDARLSETTSSEEIFRKLAATEDRLAIGGLLFMRLNYAVLEEGDPEDFPLSAPNLVDVYLDARPNERVRGFVQGRLRYDYTVDEDETGRFGQELDPLTAELDQLWLKFDIARTVYVTLGKQRIKWGTGRFWNPTDFLNNERLDALDVAVFDDRLGVTLAKVHIPVETLGWNFYAIATLGEASDPSDVGGAARAEFLYDLTEVALSAAVRKNNPLRLGADLSTGIWLFDLRLETALLHGDERPYYRGEFDPRAGIVPETISREDDWIPQVVAGAEIGVRYSDEDSVYFGGEYFYNDAGYASADLYPWLIFQGAFTPFYVGRHYAGIYGLLPAPGTLDDHTFVLSGLSNLSDRSFIARLDYSVRLLTHLTANLYGGYHFGEIGEFRFGLELPELPPALPDGLDVPPPLFEVGGGLRLAL